MTMSDRGFNTRSATSKSIEEQAAHWLVRMRSGACAEQEMAEHKAWLDANLLHWKAYRRMESLWNELGCYAGRPEIVELRRRAGVYRSTPLSPKKSGLTGSVFALAASLLLTVFAIGFSINNIWEEYSREGLYHTATGEQRSVVLDDGSRILLDTQTRLVADYSQAQRRIVLEQGQARFDVAHDRHRPFVVTAGNGSITALGTVFLVRKEVDEVVVTLLEGRVAVVHQSEVGDEGAGADEMKRELTAGQQIAYSGTNMLAMDSVNVAQAAAWQEGRLIFEDDALIEVINSLNRYSRKKIVLGDEALKSIRVTGVFKSGDNSGAVRALKSYFAVQATKDRYGNLILMPER